jgi:hypothetical protein
MNNSSHCSQPMDPWMTPLSLSGNFLGLADRAMMLEANRLQLVAENKSDCSECVQTLQQCMNPTKQPRAKPCACSNATLANQINQTCSYLYHTSR